MNNLIDTWFSLYISIFYPTFGEKIVYSVVFPMAF